jgi:hypothetical protein
MIKVTEALIIRLAKMQPKEQLQIFEDNPDANYPLMKSKCEDLCTRLDSENKLTLSEKVDDIKFMANLYMLKQKKGPENIEVTVYETMSV